MGWPDLSDIKYVSGRAATESDISDGAAVFLMQSEGVNIGVPLNIEIPQYALHFDEETSSESPVIVIQAEEGAGNQVIGAINIETNEHLVGLKHEFKFLGQEVSNE